MYTSENVVTFERTTAFQEQVRGRTALLKMLRMIHGGTAEYGAARLLTLRQRVEFYVDLRCGECGAVAEGPVRHNGSLSYEFRCPKNRCAVKAEVVRQVDLDRQLAAKCVEVFGPAFDRTIQRALDRPVPDPLIPVEPEFLVPSCHVKLTRNQAHAFRFHTIPELSALVNTALINLLRTRCQK